MSTLTCVSASTVQPYLQTSCTQHQSALQLCCPGSWYLISGCRPDFCPCLSSASGCNSVPYQRSFQIQSGRTFHYDVSFFTFVDFLKARVHLYWNVHKASPPFIYLILGIYNLYSGLQHSFPLSTIWILLNFTNLCVFDSTISHASAGWLVSHS